MKPARPGNNPPVIYKPLTPVERAHAKHLRKLLRGKS